METSKNRFSNQQNYKEKKMDPQWEPSTPHHKCTDPVSVDTV
jgi:hypothetical protein